MRTAGHVATAPTVRSRDQIIEAAAPNELQRFGADQSHSLPSSRDVIGRNFSSSVARAGSRPRDGDARTDERTVHSAGAEAVAERQAQLASSSSTALTRGSRPSSHACVQLRVVDLDQQRRVARSRRSRATRALEDDPAVVDDRDLVAGLLDLVQQVRGEEDGAALVDEARGSVARISRIPAGSRPFIGSSRISSSGRRAGSARCRAAGACRGSRSSRGRRRGRPGRRARATAAMRPSAARSRAAATIFRFSRPVRCGWKRGSSTIAPTRASASRRLAGFGRPSRRLAGGRPRQAEQRADHRRLPGAVRPEEAKGDAGRDEQVDAVDGDALAEALGQRAGLDHRFHHRRARSRRIVGAALGDDDGQVRRREQESDPRRAAPRAIPRAAPSAVNGHEPELPRGCASRQPAIRTAPRRFAVASQALHSTNGWSGWTARPARYRRSRGVVGGGALGLAHRVAVARRARVEEERAVGQLRRAREPALEVVQRGSPCRRAGPGTRCATGAARARARGTRRRPGSDARAGGTASSAGCRSRSRRAARRARCP